MAEQGKEFSSLLPLQLQGMPTIAHSGVQLGTGDEI